MESCYYLLKRDDNKTVAVLHSPSMTIVLDHASVEDYVAWAVKNWGPFNEIPARHNAWSILNDRWTFVHSKVTAFSYANAKQWAADALAAKAAAPEIELREAS